MHHRMGAMVLMAFRAVVSVSLAKNVFAGVTPPKNFQNLALIQQAKVYMELKKALGGLTLRRREGENIEGGGGSVPRLYFALQPSSFAPLYHTTKQKSVLTSACRRICHASSEQREKTRHASFHKRGGGARLVRAVRVRVRQTAPMKKKEPCSLLLYVWGAWTAIVVVIRKCTHHNVLKKRETCRSV